MDFTFDFGLNTKSLFEMLVSAFGIIFLHELNSICYKFYVLQVEQRDKEVPH